MKREIAANIDIDSLIEDITLMNCFNGKDEFKILKKSLELKEKINTLNSNEITDILKKTSIRYNRYMTHIIMEDHLEIERNIHKFLRIYMTQTSFNNLYGIYLIDLMLKIDELIMNNLQ